MTVLIVFAVLFAVLGIIGSIVPGIPGPPLSWIGMLLVFFAGRVGERPDPMSLAYLLVWLAITITVTVLDYVIPAGVTRMAGGHKAASTGAILGLFAGMILPPVGIITGSLLGAFLGELLVTDKGVWSAFKAGAGAFLGFILGTGLKLCVSGVMAWLIVKFAFL
ncbi:MAG: DUF456 domain-containing protein [Bacteroidales bacterium]|nr:DUF456 domain-containing protein [Bacteroidales bacterium]